MILRIKALTVNQAWQGRRFKTNVYKNYLESLNVYLRPLKHKIGRADRLKLTIIVGFSNSASDLDNILKPFIDGLQWKYGFNDNQIYEIVAKKEMVKKGAEFIDFDIVVI